MNSKKTRKATATTGLNLLDLGNAGREQVILVRIMLKRKEATRAEIWQEILELPEDKRMSSETLDAALQGLIDSKWLWKTGSGESATYSPRLRKKVPRAVRYKLSMNQGGASIASMWQMLDQKRSFEESLGDTIHQAHGQVAGWVGEQVSGLSAERRLVILMVFILLVGSFSISALEIVGVAGFVNSLGVQKLPWLSILEMVLGIVTSGVFIQMADRMPRERLMKLTLLGLAGVYLLMALLFVASQYLPIFGTVAARLGLDSPQALIFPLLYLLRSQQIILFPLSFWNLANSLYSMAEARKVFPILAMGGTIGGLLGYALFTNFFHLPALFTSGDAPLLLMMTAVFFGLGFFLMRATLKVEEDESEADAPKSIVQNIREGLENIHDVPLFRYMAAAVVFTRVAFTIFVFHNVFTLDKQQGSFASLLSLFGILSAILPLLLQWKAVPFFSNKIEAKDAYMVLPAVLALGLGFTTLKPDLLLPVALGLLVSGAIASSWDYPMQNTLQTLIPEKRRAQVSTLLSNYAFALGQISGSVLLLVTFAIAPLFGIESSRLYLPIGFLAALGALAMTILVSRTYTESMLSWRVARRARSSSVMDRLD